MKRGITTPTFLVDTLTRRGVNAYALDGMAGDDELLSSFDVDEIATEALLFQTGYLTIAGEERRDDRIFYRLDYPNKDVRLALNNSLLRRVAGRRGEVRERGGDLCRLLAENDFDAFAGQLRAFFAGVPYQFVDSHSAIVRKKGTCYDASAICI